jgi:coenzyme F420-reducing hydrogenase alpha subunit
MKTPEGGKRRPKPRTIKVKALARVEGEGAMYVRIRGDRVERVRLEIYEPPRFFEGFLRGRAFSEAPDITARICGICPVAYQMSACHAMEDALGVRVEGALRELRRLLYCGEWIESHALHIYLLHAPDFLGYASAVHMAKDHAPAVERGLRLKKAGNDLLDLLGGRSVHPINVRVGGFYKVPSKRALQDLSDRLELARDAALETVRWVAGFEFPDFERDYELVALRHPSEYPFNEGRIVSSRNLDIAVSEFDEHFVEEQVPHSTSLHCRIRERGNYFVGPLARYGLNHDRLSPLAREAAAEAGLGPRCANPFRSIIVRGVELVYACDEALRIIRDYEPPERPCVEVAPRAGIGHGCTEAPRGALYHRYALDDEGAIREATIVPPTSQNQPTIEGDLREFVERNLELPQDTLQWQCEQTIRNYDPCISCSTHFLKLHLDRA